MGYQFDFARLVDFTFPPTNPTRSTSRALAENVFRIRSGSSPNTWKTTSDPSAGFYDINYNFIVKIIIRFKINIIIRSTLEEVDELKKESFEELEPKDLAKMNQKGKSHTDPFVCPIKDCAESAPSKNLFLIDNPASKSMFF